MMNVPKRKDFGSLRRKLAAGKLLTDAAAESGMTVEEAQDYLAGRQGQDDESLRAFSDEALRVALTALTAAVKEGSRTIGEGYGEGRFDRYQSVDLDAAKALLKAGMDARKMLRRSKEIKIEAAAAGQVDLFDAGPWTFKDSD
jgi:hypothetical protein